MTDPSVDLIIPVHDPSRPLQRAIDSVLLSGLEVPSVLRISVVCHNIPAEQIAERLRPETRGLVRFLQLDDGEPSPAGPFMFGMRSATADYVSIMGSDDTLEPGALAAWLERAQHLGLTALIPPERHASGKKVATPPTRPWRSGLLDGARDRLAYRTAPLGLIRRESIERLGLTMPSRLRSGSDQLFGAKLWFSGERVAYGRGTPHYVVGADAVTRVTMTARPAAVELMAIDELVADPWFAALSLRARRSIVTKIVRVHIVSAAATRTTHESWTPEDRTWLSGLLSRLALSAPGYERTLSIADARLVDALSGAEASTDRLGALLAARRRFGTPATIVTRDIRGLLAADGPLRFMAASVLL